MTRTAWAALLAVLLPLVAQPSSAQDVQDPAGGPQASKALLAKLVAHDHIGKRLADAFAAVPRERFLPAYLAGMAYNDTSLPLGNGQTLPSPSDLLKAVTALGVAAEERVLVVGADSAYLAALLSRLAAHVYVVELDAPERSKARELFASLGFTNITVAATPSPGAFASDAPFPRIFVHGATETVPPALFAQLGASGRMIVPLRDPTGFEMVVELERSKGETSLTAIGKGFYSPIHLGG